MFQDICHDYVATVVLLHKQKNRSNMFSVSATSFCDLINTFSDLNVFITQLYAQSTSVFHKSLPLPDRTDTFVY